MRRLRLGILVAFGLALLEATAALGLAAFGRWDLGWVAALATLALATYTCGVALIRALTPPASRSAERAGLVRARPTAEARLNRVVARRRERWAGMRHSPRAER